MTELRRSAYEAQHGTHGLSVCCEVIDGRSRTPVARRLRNMDGVKHYSRIIQGVGIVAGCMSSSDTDHDEECVPMRPLDERT